MPLDASSGHLACYSPLDASLDRFSSYSPWRGAYEPQKGAERSQLDWRKQILNKSAENARLSPREVDLICTTVNIADQVHLQVKKHLTADYFQKNSVSLHDVLLAPRLQEYMAEANNEKRSFEEFVVEKNITDHEANIIHTVLTEINTLNAERNSQLLEAIANDQLADIQSVVKSAKPLFNLIVLGYENRAAKPMQPSVMGGVKVDCSEDLYRHGAYSMVLAWLTHKFFPDIDEANNKLAIQRKIYARGLRWKKEVTEALPSKNMREIIQYLSIKEPQGMDIIPDKMKFVNVPIFIPGHTKPYDYAYVAKSPFSEKCLTFFRRISSKEKKCTSDEEYSFAVSSDRPPIGSPKDQDPVLYNDLQKAYEHWILEN